MSGCGIETYYGNGGDIGGFSRVLGEGGRGGGGSLPRFVLSCLTIVLLFVQMVLGWMCGDVRSLSYPVQLTAKALSAFEGRGTRNNTLSLSLIQRTQKVSCAIAGIQKLQQKPHFFVVMFLVGDTGGGDGKGQFITLLLFFFSLLARKIIFLPIPFVRSRRCNRW